MVTKKAPLGLLQGALRKGGGYLLSRVTSTIGVAGLNFPVRNGEGWIPRAIAAFPFAVRFGFVAFGCRPCGLSASRSSSAL